MPLISPLCALDGYWEIIRYVCTDSRNYESQEAATTQQQKNNILNYRWLRRFIAFFFFSDILSLTRAFFDTSFAERESRGSRRRVNMPANEIKCDLKSSYTYGLSLSSRSILYIFFERLLKPFMSQMDTKCFPLCAIQVSLSRARHENEVSARRWSERERMRWIKIFIGISWWCCLCVRIYEFNQLDVWTGYWAWTRRRLERDSWFGCRWHMSIILQVCWITVASFQIYLLFCPLP